jgi:hypothetical protein
MIEQAALQPRARVLEIGSGGYQTAQLGEIVTPPGLSSPSTWTRKTPTGTSLPAAISWLSGRFAGRPAPTACREHHPPYELRTGLLSACSLPYSAVAARHVEPVLVATGDLHDVRTLLHAVLTHGNGAMRQRLAARQNGISGALDMLIHDPQLTFTEHCDTDGCERSSTASDGYAEREVVVFVCWDPEPQPEMPIATIAAATDGRRTIASPGGRLNADILDAACSVWVPTGPRRRPQHRSGRAHAKATGPGARPG